MARGSPLVSSPFSSLHVAFGSPIPTRFMSLVSCRCLLNHINLSKSNQLRSHFLIINSLSSPLAGFFSIEALKSKNYNLNKSNALKIDLKIPFCSIESKLKIEPFVVIEDCWPHLQVALVNFPLSSLHDYQE